MNTNIFTKNLDFELFEYNRKNSEVQFVDNKLKQNQTTEFEGKALRLIKDNHLALVSGTRNISDKILLKKAQNALPFASEVNFSFRDFEKFNQDSRSLESSNPSSTSEDSIKSGRNLLEKLLSFKEFDDFTYSIYYWSGKEVITIKNSSIDGKEFSRSDEGFYVVAKRVLQNDILMLGFVSHEPVPEDKIDLWLEKVEFFETIELSKNIVTLDPGKYTAIFHPEALTSMMYSLNEGLSMKNVYEKISPVKDKMNQEIFDKRITIIDDPTFEKGSKRALFDDEGTPCSKKNIVENGVLKHFYTDLDYASKSGIEPTGNAFKEMIIGDSKLLGSPPAIMPTNLYIPADKEGPSVEDMIKEIKTGFFIKNSPDCWMGNIVSGEIGGNITQGYIIENGKLVGRVKNKRFAGNLYNLLGSQLISVSNAVELATNGADRYPHIMSGDVMIT